MNKITKENVKETKLYKMISERMKSYKENNNAGKNING